MQITIQITDKRITDLLHGHGGSYSQWLHELSGSWNKPAGAKVKFDREQDEEGSGKGHKVIRAAAVKRGLAIMAQSEPYQFSQFLEENDDDITFDTALQCIIFGKTIYA